MDTITYYTIILGIRLGGDTGLFVAHLGRAGEVDDDEGGIVRLGHHELVQLHCCVHAPNVVFMPRGREVRGEERKGQRQGRRKAREGGREEGRRGRDGGTEEGGGGGGGGGGKRRKEGMWKGGEGRKGGSTRVLKRTVKGERRRKKREKESHGAEIGSAVPPNCVSSSPNISS